MINAIPCLRQKMINAIPCLRQKSPKTYPGWPHVPTKPLWGSTPPPPPGLKPPLQKIITFLIPHSVTGPLICSQPPFCCPLSNYQHCYPFFIVYYFGPFYLFFLTSMKQSSCLISVWSFKMMQNKVFPLSLAAHKTHIELTNKCYVAQIYGFH